MDYTSTDDVHTFSCVTQGSPPTQVTWERDGVEIYWNNTFYQFGQAVVDRATSVYNNTLTVKSITEDVVGEYSCTATNSLGTSNRLTKAVKGKA